MATDYAEKEREFIAALQADTGRDLSAWMQAISDAGLAHRNDTIDWLRQSGFTFANASWLERIHHNGGRLVYGDDVLPPERPTPRAIKVASQSPGVGDPPTVIEPPPLPVADPIPQPVRPAPTLVVVANPTPPPTPTPIATPPLAVDDPAIADVLLAAKGLRPLALLALRAISKAIPNATLAAQGPLLMVSAPLAFLALLPGPKTLRFYGDFAADPDSNAGAISRIARAEVQMKSIPKAVPPFPGVLVLTDARLVDETFTALIASAHARVHA